MILKNKILIVMAGKARILLRVCVGRESPTHCLLPLGSWCEQSHSSSCAEPVGLGGIFSSHCNLCSQREAKKFST